MNKQSADRKKKFAKRKLIKKKFAKFISERFA